MNAPGALIPAPDTLKFSIGGFFGDCHELELEGGRLRYATGRDGVIPESTRLLEPAIEKWARFWRAVDRIGVWEWQADYHNLDVLDGTQWSLELRHGGRAVVCEGSNAFPGNPNITISPASSFARFVRELEKLTGLKGIV